ncbi:hypothetical protein JHK82_034872 [Glycine max]|nr:hypothetical protein JHK82_054105 [Glycine max]KAG5111603.1 hypothetical protein JHK82_034872 [Glycine max]
MAEPFGLALITPVLKSALETNWPNLNSHNDEILEDKVGQTWDLSVNMDDSLQRTELSAKEGDCTITILQTYNKND